SYAAAHCSVDCPRRKPFAEGQPRDESAWLPRSPIPRAGEASYACASEMPSVSLQQEPIPFLDPACEVPPHQQRHAISLGHFVHGFHGIEAKAEYIDEIAISTRRPAKKTKLIANDDIGLLGEGQRSLCSIDAYQPRPVLT